MFTKIEEFIDRLKNTVNNRSISVKLEQFIEEKKKKFGIFC